MNGRQICYLVILVLGTSTAANAQLRFIFDVTATNSEWGYVTGEDYTFVFEYDMGSTSPVATTFPSLYYSSQTVAQPPIWADVFGDGLNGTYERPTNTPDAPRAHLGTSFLAGPTGPENSFRVTAGSDGLLSGLGLAVETDTPGGEGGGQPVGEITFEGDFDGLGLDLVVFEPDPNIYFADYFGQYDAINTINAFIQPNATALDPATFEINTLTIVPEPSALALLGIGGIAMLRRRRTRA